MEYALLLATLFLIFALSLVIIDRKNRRESVRIEPPHPFQRIPEAGIRVKLAIQVTKLLDRWNLSEEEQKKLLGISSQDEKTLEMYRYGQGLEQEVDRLGRIGHLLAIEEALSLIYKGSPDRAYRWVSKENRHMSGCRPLDLMKKGYEGLLAVRRYLDFERGI